MFDFRLSRKGETKINMSRYTRDKLMKMEPDLLRAILRERTHHTLEHRINSIIADKKEPYSVLS